MRCCIVFVSDLAPSGDVKRSPDGVELSSTTNILDFQLNELNAYRDAIRRMERDILGLHDQVRLLQNTNAQLRRQAVSRSPTAIKRTVEETEVVPEATDDGRLSVGEMDAKLWEKTELEERYGTNRTPLSCHSGLLSALYVVIVRRHFAFVSGYMHFEPAG